MEKHDGETLRNRMKDLGAKTAQSFDQLPQYYTYAVTNGLNILAIGAAGSKPRIRSFFSGSSGSAVHTKAFIVSLGSALFGPNTIQFIPQSNKEQAFCLEEQIKDEGFRTLYIIDRPEITELYDVSKYMWNTLLMLKDKTVSKELTSILELVFDNGDVLKSVLRRLSREAEELNILLNNFYHLNKKNEAKSTLVIPNLEVDKMRATIKKSQIEKAIAYINTEAGKTCGMTKTYYFQTSVRNIVFEVQKPTRTGRLVDILSIFNKSNVTEYEFSGMQTGDASGNQFSSGVESCYLMKKAKGFEDKGANYFRFS